MNVPPILKPVNQNPDVIPFAADLTTHNEGQLEFQTAVMRLLNSDKTRIIVFDPAKGRTGILIFITVNSPDTSLHFAVCKRKKAEDPLDLDLPDDSIEIKWLDEKGMQYGNILYVNRSDEFMYRNNRYPVTSQDVIQEWKDTGGIDYVPEERPNPGVTDDHLSAFARALNTGYVDEVAMKTAEEHAFSRWNARSFTRI